jgi:hypothetical protein
MKSLKEHIVKVSGGYRLVSKKTGKNLGTYPSKAGAEKRERQVQYFKHMGEEKQVPHPDILPPAGAGNDASDELVHSYTRDTPGQIVKKVKSFKDYTK